MACVAESTADNKEHDACTGHVALRPCLLAIETICTCRVVHRAPQPRVRVGLEIRAECAPACVARAGLRALAVLAPSYKHAMIALARCHRHRPVRCTRLDHAATTAASRLLVRRRRCPHAGRAGSKRRGRGKINSREILARPQRHARVGAPVQRRNWRTMRVGGRARPVRFAHPCCSVVPGPAGTHAAAADVLAPAVNGLAAQWCAERIEFLFLVCGAGGVRVAGQKERAHQHKHKHVPVAVTRRFDGAAGDSAPLCNHHRGTIEGVRDIADPHAPHALACCIRRGIRLTRRRLVLARRRLRAQLLEATEGIDDAVDGVAPLDVGKPAVKLVHVAAPAIA